MKRLQSQPIPAPVTQTNHRWIIRISCQFLLFCFGLNQLWLKFFGWWTCLFLLYFVHKFHIKKVILNTFCSSLSTHRDTHHTSMIRHRDCTVHVNVLLLYECERVCVGFCLSYGKWHLFNDWLCISISKQHTTNLADDDDSAQTNKDCCHFYCLLFFLYAHSQRWWNKKRKILMCIENIYESMERGWTR